MSWQLWMVFAPACLAISLSPGPNNLLAMSNGVRFGFARAMGGACGRLVVFAGMITMTAVGLGALFAASELAFHVIKWAGAAYLLFLGVKLWRAPAVAPADASAVSRTVASVKVLARQEGLIAAGNPKAILTFTAFLPQFLDPAGDALAQFSVMGATFVTLEGAAAGIYAVAGSHLRAFTRSARGMRIVNRVSGTAMFGAGLLLAAARRA